MKISVLLAALLLLFSCTDKDSKQSQGLNCQDSTSSFGLWDQDNGVPVYRTTFSYL